MAIPHASACEVVDVSPLKDLLRTTRTSAIFKSQDLEVIRLVLKAGESLPPHKVPGEITVHCIEGRLSVSCGSHISNLNAGEMLFVTGSTEHAVRALNDSSALVTIALKH